MHDLEQINIIIKDAVESSSYTTVIISSCVFIAYTLIIKLVDLYKAKSRNKPMIEMATAIKEVSNNVVKLNAVLDKTLKDADTKNVEKVDNIIELGFDSFRSAITKFCEDIIVHNNIETNKNLIEQNIYRTISTKYYRLYSMLSLYEINNVNVASKLDKKWIDDIANEVISIIYNKQDAALRINQMSNRLLVMTNEYSVFVNNKIFNH